MNQIINTETYTDARDKMHRIDHLLTWQEMTTEEREELTRLHNDIAKGMEQLLTAARALKSDMLKAERLCADVGGLRAVCVNIARA